MASTHQQVPNSLDAALTRAQREGKEGYHRDSDGKFVDPKPVQLFVIWQGFASASEREDFDIWTVADPRVVREGDTVAENFQRVYAKWDDTTDDVAQEVADQLESLGHELES